MFNLIRCAKKWAENGSVWAFQVKYLIENLFFCRIGSFILLGNKIANLFFLVEGRTPLGFFRGPSSRG